MKISILKPKVLELINEVLKTEIPFDVYIYAEEVLKYFQGIDLKEPIGDRLDMTTHPNQMYAFVEIT